jgi:Mg-chelatase subunit ChlD
MVSFSTDVTLAEPIADVSRVAETLRNRVLALVADGDTNLNGAVCAATQLIGQEAARDAEAGDNRLYGIVLLSDGQDTVGAISQTRMFQTCLGTREGEEGTKFFVIGLGEGVDEDLLKRLASDTNGTYFTADPASIGQTYLRISAEQ